RLAIEAVFKSWNGKRARDYRRQNKIADDLGTAVNVVAMVFGNRGMDSGTGVAFTRDPATGERVAYGDYLPNAQGEDVVAGIRNTLRLQELADLDPKSYSELREAMDTLERHYRDMCDIEFTIEKGKLWILQTRVGKRTAFAEWVMAYDMLEEKASPLSAARMASRSIPPRGRSAPMGLLSATGSSSQSMGSTVRSMLENWSSKNRSSSARGEGTRAQDRRRSGRRSSGSWVTPTAPGGCACGRTRIRPTRRGT